MVSEHAGTPVPYVVMRDQGKEDWPALHEFAYEMHNVIELNRTASSSEARSAISWFFKQWALENPSEELRYMEIEGMGAGEAARFGLSGPSYHITTHIIHHLGLGEGYVVAIGAIAAAVAAVLAWVFANKLAILVVGALVIALIAMWRFQNYWIPDRQIYKCPKEGEEFDSWANFEIHFTVVHSDQQLPPKPSNWTDYIKFAAIGISGMIMVWVGLKLFRRKGKEEPRRWHYYD